MPSFRDEKHTDSVLNQIFQIGTFPFTAVLFIFCRNDSCDRKRSVNIYFCAEHGSGVLWDCGYFTNNPLLSCHLTYVDMASCPYGRALNIPLEVSLYILVMISTSSVLLHLRKIILSFFATPILSCVEKLF